MKRNLEKLEKNAEIFVFLVKMVKNYRKN